MDLFSGHTKTSCRAEASGSSDGLGEVLHFLDFGSRDLFDDELCNAIALFYGKVGISEVEEKDAEQTAVVFVDDTSAYINTVLTGQTASRRYSSVVAGWNGETDAGLNDFATAAW